MMIAKRIKKFVLAIILVFTVISAVEVPTGNTDKGETNPSPATTPNLTTDTEPKEPEVAPTTQQQPKKEVKTYTFIITFYTELEGGGQGITASGKKISYGMVANNQLPFGTEIQIKGMGTFTVEDRGSQRHFNQVERIDMYIPRQSDESNTVYKARVNAMGVKRINGIVIGANIKES